MGEKNPLVVRLPPVGRPKTYDRDEVLEKALGVMDLAAVALCRANGLPIVVFDGTRPGEIARAAGGERVGTIVGGT